LTATTTTTTFYASNQSTFFTCTNFLLREGTEGKECSIKIIELELVAVPNSRPQLERRSIKEIPKKIPRKRS